MIYSLCLLLILVGLYGVVVSRQTVKIVISLLIVQHGVHLLLLLIGLVAGLQLATGLRTVTVVMLVVPLISLAWIARQKQPPFPQAEFTASLSGRVTSTLD